MSTSIRKAVIPVAGLGTRFLPATKTVPKELFPLLGKPALQFVIEEAVSSGVETVILVMSSRKGAILDYFRRDPAFEALLLAGGKEMELTMLERLSRLCRIEPVYQHSPLGLGDAIRCARTAVGEEPFLVLLPDVIILSEVPCARQLINCYARHRGTIIATREVPREELGRFGILSINGSGDNGDVCRVNGMVEKPHLDVAPSRLGIFGRYLLEPGIFDCFQSSPAASCEVQLTDAIASYAARHPVYGCRFQGDHFDTGDKLGFAEATVELALRDGEHGEEFLRFLLARLNAIARHQCDISQD